MKVPRKHILAEGILAMAGIAFFVTALFMGGPVRITGQFAGIGGGGMLPYATQRISPAPPVLHAEQIRAAHFSYGSFAPERREGILAWLDTTNLNGVVMAVRNEAGLVAFFHPDTTRYVYDFVEELHARGMYAIARIPVFQDNRRAAQRPDLAIKDSATGKPWKTYAGAGWLDPTQPENCAYAVDIAGRAVDAGFDEINLDYIRFPTDGPLHRAVYAYPERAEEKDHVIASCLAYAREVLGPDVIISADVFGMAFITKDNGIGQDIALMAQYIDVISPMAYPSHYSSGFVGVANPAQYPYEVIAHTLDVGMPRLPPDTIVRPWYQDFDLGAYYGAGEVRAQIQAGVDRGLETWFLWNARDSYTIEALR